MDLLPAPLQRVSGLHVETVVGQMPGGAVVDSVDETRWVCQQLEPWDQPFGIVSYVHLNREESLIELDLAQHLEVSQERLRGVRMILNHHPDQPELTWPQIEHGDFFGQAPFRRSLALLAKNDLSFDLSCHPHQVADAIDALHSVPDLRIAINHLGFLHDGESEAHEDLWRQGLHALASLPQAYMKLSMLWFGCDGYHSDPVKTSFMRDRVRETIDIFGVERCMFASNYPVDRFKHIDIPTLYGQFLEWSTEYTRDEQIALFHDTAQRAYGAL
tara:strand:+ start:2531 stop:3349 length:819 start_codon:yes stop_codon:yes gene_type:complete